MRKNKKIIALLAILAFSFIAAVGLSAQTTGEGDDLDEELSLVNDEGEQDLEGLLLKLSVEFNVDLVVLQDLSTQGYAPGEIWLALEISQATEKPLAESILLADGVEGHGWGHPRPDHRHSPRIGRVLCPQTEMGQPPGQNLQGNEAGARKQRRRQGQRRW